MWLLNCGIFVELSGILTKVLNLLMDPCDTVIPSSMDSLNEVIW